MGVEIERKFLVVNDSWRGAVRRAVPIMQGYLARTDRATVRVRVMGDQGYITVKGNTAGVTRSEYEYRIPAADARAMLTDLAAGPVIDKVRHMVDAAGREWVIDVFAGENEGLVLAEIELPAEDTEFEKPGWAGAEVSHDARYFNVNLAERPFRSWA